MTINEKIEENEEPVWYAKVQQPQTADESKDYKT
jgi:hypothetical protein